MWCSGPCEGARNGVPAFLASVSDLCVRSRNDWYRVYLIRKVCSQQGVEVVQKLQTMAEFKWLFPEQILQVSAVSATTPDLDHMRCCGQEWGVWGGLFNLPYMLKAVYSVGSTMGCAIFM